MAFTEEKIASILSIGSASCPIMCVEARKKKKKKKKKRGKKQVQSENVSYATVIIIRIKKKIVEITLVYRIM